MLRNGQSNLFAALHQFNVLARRFAARKSKVSKLKNAHLNAKPPEASKTHEAVSEDLVNAYFLARNIGSTQYKWSSILAMNPELQSLKRKDVANSAQCLKSLQLNIEDIMSKPKILYCSASTIYNRHGVLQECGFGVINIALLVKYVTVMNKPVTMLKSHGYIPYELDMSRRLIGCFTDLTVEMPDAATQFSESLELKVMRQIVLDQYLRQRLGMTNADIEKMWKVYMRVRHRSFRSVQAMIQVLLDELHFPKERIIKNAYLLHGDAENVRRILNEVPAIAGQDVREIVYRRPKILMSSCEALLKTLQYIKSFGIGDEAIIRCLEILTLGPETVLERLRDMHEIEEFKVLISNPRVLRLVHYQNKARLRLEYLNQLKVKCASLHILAGGSEKFAKFARDGSDRTKGRDIVVYLSNVMQKEVQDIRTLLSRHPNWCHIPVIHVKQCLDYLRSKKFPMESIYRNIHILLYPIPRIEEKMLDLQEPDVLEDLQLNIADIHQLSNNELLTLILYLIECEFHFTGDGVWTDQHTQPVENFNNLLPDFPESINKVYKYGVKPAEHLQTNSKRQEVMTPNT